MLDGRELLLPFDEFPWFREATIEQIHDLERPHPGLPSVARPRRRSERGFDRASGALPAHLEGFEGRLHRRLSGHRARVKSKPENGIPRLKSGYGGVITTPPGLICHRDLRDHRVVGRRDRSDRRMATRKERARRPPSSRPAVGSPARRPRSRRAARTARARPVRGRGRRRRCQKRGPRKGGNDPGGDGQASHSEPGPGERGASCHAMPHTG